MLVVCLTVVLKLVIAVFLFCIFKQSDRNDLIFFGHFKNVSIYDRMCEPSTLASQCETGPPRNLYFDFTIHLAFRGLDFFLRFSKYFAVLKFFFIATHYHFSSFVF